MENVSCVLEKNVYTVVAGWSVVLKSLRSVGCLSFQFKDKTKIENLKESKNIPIILM